MDIQEILSILPHRYPFLLVDKVIECDDKKHIVGIKNVTVNEPFFMGHFPNKPIMPGVLQIEAMAQAGGLLLSRVTGQKGNIPLFVAIDKARFRRIVVPGNQLRITADIINRRSNVTRLQCTTSVDGQLASEAELMCMFTEEKVNQQ
jgi:3-hydroxyacyl-[acyl-carrier-protein] dehydratase